MHIHDMYHWAQQVQKSRKLHFPQSPSAFVSFPEADSITNVSDIFITRTKYRTDSETTHGKLSNTLHVTPTTTQLMEV